MTEYRKRVVVLQPQYLPWAGVFDQIRLAHVFVHFDDVQLPQGRSFSNRVQIKTDQGQSWLTVPLVRSSRGMIRDVLIDESSAWRSDHRKVIHRWLSRAPHYDEVAPMVERIFGFETKSLADFNIHAIELLAGHLGLERKFLRSSELGVNAHSSEKLCGIVKRLEGDCYVTGHGARNYLDHEIFERSGVGVEYIDYQLSPYGQFHGEFTPYVTVLDLIAHAGPASLSHMQSKLIPWREFTAGQ